MSATLIVVRHGEAEGNDDHRLIGQSEVPLTEHGRRQSEALAQRLQAEPITRIVSSDLSRSLDTIGPLADALGLPPETDPRLREIDNGEWTGLLPSEIRARWPELWEAYVAGEDVPRPGGERWRDVARRVTAGVTPLLEDAGTVVVATHGGPALILALWASGHSVEGNIFRSRLGALHNASITVIDAGPRLVSFNDIGHLATIPDRRLPFT